jgi:hypothetical protein
LSNTGSAENYDDINTYNETKEICIHQHVSQHSSWSLQDSENKFLLRGRYKSSGGDGIQLVLSMYHKDLLW